MGRGQLAGRKGRGRFRCDVEWLQLSDEPADIPDSISHMGVVGHTFIEILVQAAGSAEEGAQFAVMRFHRKTVKCNEQ